MFTWTEEAKILLKKDDDVSEGSTKRDRDKKGTVDIKTIDVRYVR